MTSRLSAGAGFALAILWAVSAQAIVLTPEARDSELVIAPFNLGFNPGFGTGSAGGGADVPILLTATTLALPADLAAAGALYYGPDTFGRVNSGDFDALQIVDWVTTGSDAGIRVLLDQMSSIDADQASPVIDIDNTASVYFTLDEDVDAFIHITFDGVLNNGDDRVRLEIRDVDEEGDPIGTAEFSLFFHVNFSGALIDPNGDSFWAPVSLETGPTYEMWVDGENRLAIDNGSQHSMIDARLYVPEPEPLPSIAIAGLALVMMRLRVRVRSN